MVMGLLLVSHLGLCARAGEPLQSNQQQPSAEAGRVKGKLNKLYFAVSTCAGDSCHSAGKPAQNVSPPLCRCNELAIWTKEDKHRDAFNNLLKKPGQDMCKLLGITDVSKEERCLTCHAVYIKPSERQAVVDKDFTESDGVSCVVCHGPYEEWVKEHSVTTARGRERWRTWSRQKKEQDYGMTDLWNPERRSALCASCHVGNAAEGKVVTHEMYAAGHPPLPSFEVSTFSDKMPRHWQYLQEKLKEYSKPKEQEFLIGYYLKQQATENLTSQQLEALNKFEKTRLAAIAAIDLLRRNCAYLAVETMPKRPGEAEFVSLDFAEFDCYACHHDLAANSWRQKRGTSGRPQMREWPAVLVKGILQFLGDDQAKFDEALQKLRQAFDERPFGDTAKIHSTAADMEKWCADAAERLSRKTIDRQTAIALLKRLCTLATEETLDYDSARQVGWAFEIVYSELYPDEQARPATVGSLLTQLKKEIRLDLPSGAGRSIESELPQLFQQIYGYNPGRVQKIFGELSREVPEK
jgi:hypothetical protein